MDNKVATAKDYWKRDWIEINTYADIMCTGTTSEKHKATGKVVDVSRFHGLLNTMKSVEVLTDITTINLDCDTIIGVFNEFL